MVRTLADLSRPLAGTAGSTSSGGRTSVIAVTPLLALLAALAPGEERPAWGLVAHETPPALAPGARAQVRVELINLGDQTWSEEQRDRLAYHWRDARGEVVVRDGERTRLPAALPPGQSLALTATLVAPPAPGSYTLEWALVREGRFWYPSPARGEPVVPVDVGPALEAWSLEPLELPAALPARGRGSAQVRLCNLGPSAWSSALGDALSYRWLGPEGQITEGIRTAIDPVQDPGACRTLRADLLAPERPGRYRLEWEPVREGVAWYGPPASGARLVDLTIGPPRDAFAVLAAELPPLSAGLPAEARLVLLNTGAETWSPGHGLHVSYKWNDLALEGARTELPGETPPGEAVELAVRVAPPDLPGDHPLAWHLVREGEAWIPPERGGDALARVGPRALAWELRDVAWPSGLDAGESSSLRVTVRNTGAETWSPDLGDRLSYHWRTLAGAPLAHDGLRTELPRPLAPGDELTLELRLAAPPRPGEFLLELGMLREQVAWFGAPTGLPSSQVLAVRSPAALRQALLLLGTLLALFLARRRRPPPGSPLWSLHALAPALWLWLATLVACATFTELAAIDLWQGGRAATLSGAAVPALLLLLLPARVRPALAFILSLGTATLFLADLLYLQVLGAIVPARGLIGVHQLSDIGASVRALLRPEYAWLATYPLAGLALALAWPAPPQDAGPPPRLQRRAHRLALALAALACLPITCALHGAMTGILGVRVFSEQHNVGRFGVLGAHLFDLARTTRDALARRELPPDRRRELAASFADRPTHERAPSFGVARGANLLVIQAEALQGWVIGAALRGQEITPFLNRLRQRALYFSGVVDVTAQGMTSDAEYAVLKAHYPLSQGALAFLRADNTFVTAAHALAGRGYSTLSAHPFKRGFWNRAVLHPRYGFERSLFAEELGPGPTIGWGLADDAFFARVLPELVAADKPFFAFLITLSLHHPYDEFPAALRRLDLGELEGTSLGNYLHGIHHLDRALARLFADLEAVGLARDTAVAIYGDHDCRLGTTPEIAALAGEPAGSPSLPLRLERIPFFLALPSGQAGEVELVGSHIDLAPTWLHYLGVPAPRSFLGRPLIPDAADARVAALADGSAVGDDLLFVSAGGEIPPEGACFPRAGHPRLERAACDRLVARAHLELALSHDVLDHDLAAELARPEAR